MIRHHTQLVPSQWHQQSSHHAEGFGLDVLAAFHCVVDVCKRRLVQSLQVNLQATSSVKAPVAMVALEVLRLLVLDQDLLVVEIALAVIAPWARDDVFDVRLASLLLVDHVCGVDDAIDVMCE